MWLNGLRINGGALSQLERIISRRSLIQTALVAPATALLVPRSASALDMPLGFVSPAAQTSNTIISNYQAGYIPPNAISSHYGTASNLCGYWAGSGWNVTIPAILQQVYQYDPSVPQRTTQYIAIGSEQTGIPLHPLTYNQFPSPDIPTIYSWIGSDLGGVQSSYLNSLTQMVSGYQGVSYRLREELREKNRKIQAAILRHGSAQAHLLKVINWSNVLTGAGVLVAAGAALIAAAVAAPVAGALAAAGIGIGVLWAVGTGLIVVGAFLASWGIYEAMQEQGYDGGGGGGHNQGCTDPAIVCVI